MVQLVPVPLNYHHCRQLIAIGTSGANDATDAIGTIF
jgi:hypothetical protein